MSLDNQQACLPAWKLFLLVSKVEHIPCCFIQFHLIWFNLLEFNLEKLPRIFSCLYLDQGPPLPPCHVFAHNFANTRTGASPEAPYMTVLTKNVIGVIRVIVISFQLWALIFLRDHM